MKQHICSLAAILLFIFSSNGQTLTGSDADNRVKGAEMVVMSAHSAFPSYIRLRKNNAVDAAQALYWMKTNLKLNAQMGFQLLNTQKDSLGMTHDRYQQTFNTLPVEGSIYIVHAEKGKIVSMNGELSNPVNLSTQPSLREAAALDKALGYMHASSYRWQSAAQENELKKRTHDDQATYFPKGLLIIVTLHKGSSNESSRLAWRFDIYAEKPLMRKYVFVDAQNGAILYTQNRIENADANGTAVTAYSGIQPITTDSTAVHNYILNETARGNGIETLNLQTGTDYSTAVNFTDADDYWNNVDAALDQYATDAHWGAEKTYDFYFQKFGRNSIDGNGFKLISYVHYSVGYLNAFWDGTEMNYGDGSTGYTPLTSPEIAGHEISHGLTQFTSALVENDESGALNEGFSDCMGASIRHFGEQSTVIDWVIGDEIGGTPFRSMSDPKLYGDPDTYLGTNWYTGTNDDGGVHQNSTILSHCYYLLTAGGSGTNDNGDAYTISGIGIQESEAIWFRMNTVYLTPNVTYADARTYAIQSAVDLFGTCSNEVIQTTNAWHAVGVGNVFSLSVAGAFAADITSSCSVPASITFSNTSSNAGTYIWNFGDSDTSNKADPTHVYTSYGTYTVTLIAAGGACGTDTVKKPAYITITNENPVVNTAGAICKGASTTLTATGADTVKWYTAATGGSPVATGKVFNTPALTAATMYYAESDIYPAKITGGAADSAIGAGGYFTNATVERALVLNCLSPATLVSAVVYAAAGGSRTIDLRDSAGTVLISKTFSIPAGKSVVALNFNIPAGTNMQLGCGNDPDLFRNSAGAVYPYNIGGLISITGNNAGSTALSYYYFFYDWVVQPPPCITARTPYTINVDTAIFSYHSSTLTVQFTYAGTSATTWLWKFGDGDTSSVQNPQHIYSSGGFYTVELVTQNGGCRDSTYQTINLIATGFTEYSKSAFVLYPNPAADRFTVSGSSMSAVATLKIYNMLGEKAMEQELKLNEHPAIDVSGFATGVYFVQVEDGNGRWVGKLVKN